MPVVPVVPVVGKYIFLTAMQGQKAGEWLTILPHKISGGVLKAAAYLRLKWCGNQNLNGVLQISIKGLALS